MVKKKFYLCNAQSSPPGDKIEFQCDRWVFGVSLPNRYHVLRRGFLGLACAAIFFYNCRIPTKHNTPDRFAANITVQSENESGRNLLSGV